MVVFDRGRDDHVVHAIVVFSFVYISGLLLVLFASFRR